MKLENIVEQVDHMFDTLVATRRHIHQHPELSQHEYETQKYIMAFLEKEGIPYKAMADTGVMAWVEGTGEGRVVGVRGDIDALPVVEDNAAPYCSVNQGVMHACGHDAHTTITLGCAKFFAANRDSFKGMVKFFFQPAEETVGGAKRMIAEGCMENPKVDAVIGLHVAPEIDYNQVLLKYGTLNASTNEIKLTVKGKTGHGAYPDHGIDAVMIAAHIIVAMQTVVSRNISPLDSTVISFGKITGGTKANIIADEVQLLGTIRANGPAVRAKMLERARAIATGVAQTLGGECIVEIDEEGYPSLVNNSAIIDMMAVNAKAYLGEENVDLNPMMSMGAEDFSFFNENTDGAYFTLGCRVQEKEPYILHAKNFDIDDRCLKTGVVLQVQNVYTLLNKGEE